MQSRVRGCAASGYLAAFIALCAAGAASAQSLSDWLEQGKVIVDTRFRYEGVDDQSKTLYADAMTLRARLGFETADWNNLSLAAEFDEVVAFGAQDYNSTRNGKTAYPTVGDPSMTALNRLQLSYVTGLDTKIIIGRQRILLGNQRFIGNSAWRQASRARRPRLA